jgi:hypothetical protein
MRCVATLYSEPSWRSTEGTPLSRWPQRRTVHESRVHRQASSYARAVKQSRCSSGRGKLWCRCGSHVQARRIGCGRRTTARNPEASTRHNGAVRLQTVEFGWLHPDQAARALLGVVPPWDKPPHSRQPHTVPRTLKPTRTRAHTHTVEAQLCFRALRAFAPYELHTNRPISAHCIHQPYDVHGATKAPSNRMAVR